jgi:DNA-binding transcriptional regulator LsrR (DeoR family)
MVAAQGTMGRLDELRLMTRVAHLYYEDGLKQPEIAGQLNLSQATVSRLLKRAEDEQIVRITVSVPVGAYPDLEEALLRRYGLKEVVVVDSLRDDEADVMRDLGAAAAYYVETTLRPTEVIGIASYASLLAMVNAMHPRPLRGAGRGAAEGGVRVVQLTGGLGNPAAEAHGTQLTRRLAALVHGEAVFLPAPGLAASPSARDLFWQDPFVRHALETFDHVTLALVGIAPAWGAGHEGLATSFMGSFTPEEREQLVRLGAAGFICHRFYDSRGVPLATPFDTRLTAITPEQLHRVERRVGITGGERRTAAIRAALEGGWVNVLITDQFTAQRLLEERPK